MADREIKIPITGDSSNYKKALSEAEDATGDFANKAQGFGKAIAAVFAAKEVGEFVGDAISSASDYNETVSKSKVVFGEASDAVIAFGEDAATSLGLSKQAALDAQATFGIFGKSAGLAGDELSGFSSDLTTLAADMGSFSNTSPEQAIEAIGAALRGESEPIRAYGVLLDDAKLRARALELGIYDGSGALTAQQKILAAQAEIYAQTSDAQGDFGRTSGGLAGQQKILTAEWANMREEIGERLLPIAQKLVTLLNAVGFGGDAAAKSFEGVTKATTEFGGAWENVADAFAQLVVDTGNARSGVDKLKHGIGDFFDQLAPGDDHGEALRNFNKAFGDLADKSPEDARKVVDALDELLDAADAGNQGAKDWAKSYDLTRDSLAEMAASLPPVTDAVEDQTDVVDKGAIGIQHLNEQMQAQSDAATNTAKQLEAATKRQEELTKATEDATKATQDAAHAQLSLEQSLIDIDSAYYSLQQQTEANTKAQKDSQLTDGEKAQSTRDLQSATLGLTDQVLSAAEEYAGLNGDLEGSKQNSDRLRDSLLDQKAKYPELAAAIDAYLEKLKLIPTQIYTELVLSQINKGVTIPGFKGAQASGGPVSPGTWLVGEKGPELLDLNGSGHVYNNGETNALLNGGGNGGSAGPITVNITMPVGTNGDDLVRAIKKYEQRNGPGWRNGAGGISGGTP